MRGEPDASRKENFNSRGEGQRAAMMKRVTSLSQGADTMSTFRIVARRPEEFQKRYVPENKTSISEKSMTRHRLKKRLRYDRDQGLRPRKARKEPFSREIERGLRWKGSQFRRRTQNLFLQRTSWGEKREGRPPSFEKKKKRVRHHPVRPGKGPDLGGAMPGDGERWVLPRSKGKSRN